MTMNQLFNVSVFIASLCLYINTGEAAKINTPRVLLPWLPDLNVNFTFEIHEGGCYTWSLSRDDIITLEPLHEDTWGHCSRAARVSVSKNCVPPGSVIILAEEVNTGEVRRFKIKAGTYPFVERSKILRGDVDIDKITHLKVISTTWRLYLEEAPEAYEVIAYDDQGNKFSTLEGIHFKWTVENIGSTVGSDPLVKLVRWRDTDYEAPKGVAEVEATGQRASTVLLYGQAIGDALVTVCLRETCTDFTLNVVASVVLTPAVATVALGDTIRYKVVQARAGKLTVQNIADTLYYIHLPDKSTALLEDNFSLVRGSKLGTTSVVLMSGSTEVASASLTVSQPHSIKVHIRPAELLITGEPFTIHAIVYDKSGHALTAGDDMLIRLTAEGEANVDLMRSTENGTVTEAVANYVGGFTITAKLHSIAGKTLSHKVEGEASAVVVEPLEVVPPELFIAWTDTVQNIPLRHAGGGEEIVTWSESDGTHSAISLAPTGLVTLRGIGHLGVRVQLKKYSHVQAFGKIYSISPEMIQVASTGHARVGRPHYLHVALTATHPEDGQLFNFDICSCASFSLSLLEGPEPMNVTAATWVQPVEGACCVLQSVWEARGVATVRVSRGRVGATARVVVRAAPKLLWPDGAAVLVGGTLPVLAEGEALTALSSEPKVVDLSSRDGPAPYRHPDVQLYTLKCRRKGDSRLEIISESEDEVERVGFETSCAPHVSRLRLEPSETPGNCTGGTKVWLRPGYEVTIKVTLLDAIGRELLDERGPKVSWDIEPYHAGIAYSATDRLYVETNPEYDPVPVPFKYFQLMVAEEQAIGWTGTIKATIPEATASIQAKVVAPLKVEPLKVNLAWEGETVSNIASISGGSGRYALETPAGVSGVVNQAIVGISAPAPGTYDVYVIDLCVRERQIVEVNIEEVMAVEISTARAVGVNSCVPISALVKGVSHRYLSTSRSPDWRVVGDVEVRRGELCGLREGTGRVRTAFAGVWSSEVEILVFPPLQIIPAKARVPPGAKLQLRHVGGPPPHLASLTYKLISGANHVDVAPSGSLHGISLGTARIKLVAVDIANLLMASAESEVEVIPISGLRVHSATQTLLVGAPSPISIEAVGLSTSSLSAVQPPPRVTFSVRDPATARVYTTHYDDKLERSVAEGLSVRVVPLKPGLITVDVRVRNMGQVAETRSWDSTIEILAITEIRTSIEGHPTELNPGSRLAIALGSTLRLKSLPKSDWKSYGDAFEVNSNGEIKTLKVGHGVIIATHNDERNNIYRESVIHVEVSTPHYCTVEPSGDNDENAVRVVMRNNVGRELIAPDANLTVLSPLAAHSRRAAYSALGTELVVAGLESSGAFMAIQGTVGAVTVTDEVWLTGSDAAADRVVATGSWAICLEGIGWQTPPGVSLHPGSGVTLAVLTRDTSAKHVLRLERATITHTVHQIPVQKMEFLPGEWPSAMVPLSIEAAGAKGGPLLCEEEQKYALVGVKVDLPITCRTRLPHTAQPQLDISQGQIGCSIIPAHPITEASEIELCAEWEAYRTCTKVLLLPLVEISTTTVALSEPNPMFTISGHPQALKAVKMTTSPGLRIEPVVKNNEMQVLIKNEDVVCGMGWINVWSRLTLQEFRVEVERECQSACGTWLGVLFALMMPFVPTIASLVAVVGGLMFVQTKMQQRRVMTLIEDKSQSVIPPDSSPTFNRSRTWARSPYASNGPVTPVYGDTSILPDTSFSPSSSRTHSRFL